nr:xylulose kinase-1 [Tanacetum cinerariifolium]
MTLTFAETHNMVFYLSKSDACEGFNQIIDFLNGSSIKYALTVNPNIYVSCIKQFWTTVAVKKVNDVTRLQALVDKNKVVVTEVIIRDALCLDDAEGVECKGFSRVETPLFEGMIVEQQVAEGYDDEVHDGGVPVVGNTAEGDVNIPSTSYVQPTPPQSPQAQQPQSPPPQPQQDAGIPMNLLQEVMDTCTALTRRVEHLELDKIAQALEITKLKRRVKKLKRRNKVKVLKLRRLQKGRKAEYQAKIYRIDLEHANKVLSIITAAPIRRRNGVVIRDPEESTTPSTIFPAETKSKDNGKGILVEEPKPLKKQAQIKQYEKYARELEAELNRTIDWDEVIDHVNKKAKVDNVIKRYQAMKRKPQTEAQARKNIMIYLKNTKEQIEEEESRALKRLNETPVEKAAKRHKLDEEVEELKRHLQIVPNEDDDIYTEATPLAHKVPVVD